MSRRPAAPLPVSSSPWARLPGLVAATGAFLLPFIPDQKIARLKLEGVELFVLSMFAAVAVRALFAREIGRPPKAIPIAVGAWLLVNGALSLVSPDRALAFRELGRVATSAAAFLVFSFAGMDTRSLRVFFGAWTISAALVSVYGILQYNGGAGPLLVPEMNRPIGTFGNPIFFAAFLVPSLFVAFAAWRMFSSAGSRALISSAVALEGVALLLAQTRSAYLALSAAFVAMAVCQRRFRLSAAAVLLVCAAAAGVIASRDQAHALIWRDTVKMWRTSPSLGVGLGAFHVHLRDVAGDDLKAKWPEGEFIVNFAHNEYLQTLAEGGPLALGALLAVLGIFLATFRRQTDVVTLFIGAAALAGFAQNAASADFRFGVSQVFTFLLMALFAVRADGESAAMLAVPPGAVPLCAAGLASAIAVGSWRVSRFSNERNVATAPGFFEERIVNPEKAISALESANRDSRNDPQELEQLAFVYAKQMRRADGTGDPVMADKAVQTFRAVLALDPSRAAAHNNLANALFTMGRTEEAAPEWRRAAELDGRYLDPRLNLGKTAYARGDLKEASRWFQDVLKIDPSNAEAALFLRRMVE